jgi:hypothetical protein
MKWCVAAFAKGKVSTMTHDEWKAAVVKLLKYPEAEGLREKVWRDAYVRNLSPESAAILIDRTYYNGLSPAERRKLGGTPSAADGERVRRRFSLVRKTNRRA